MTEPLIQGSIAETVACVHAGKTTARALVDMHLERIRKRSDLNAFIRVMEEEAHAAADRIDRQRDRAGNSAPLSGIPIAVKDNILVENVPCTCASRMLADWIAPYSATVVERLRDAGAVIVGKTNCDEFGMGSSNENSHYGQVKNPHDPGRVPGGSSGGSAVAVADFQAMAALGSDTGGSVRLPASFCGVVGLKPTYGAVSRWGLVAFASSLDQIGVLARRVDDAEAVFNVIRGHDPRDSTSMPVDTPRPLPESPTIGIPREYFGEGLCDDVRRAVENVIAGFRKQGRHLVEVSLPHARYAVAAYYVICCAEASSNLARYDGVKYGHRAAAAADLLSMYEKTRAEGFGTEVKRRILLGTHVLSTGYYDAYYGTAQKVRALIADDFARAFRSVDCLLTPTASTGAFKLGEMIDDPLAMYLMDVYTTSVNLAGLPALSVPCGRTKENLPIGAQVIGKPFEESLILHVGRRIEQMTAG